MSTGYCLGCGTDLAVHGRQCSGARPVLVGMNNPLSLDPRHALAPFPANCTGHRVWRMLNQADPSVTKLRYMQRFERIDLVESTVWCRRTARTGGPTLRARLIRDCRTAVALGAEVRDAMGLKHLQPMEWQQGIFETWRLCWVPHPSGRNPWYRDAENCRQIGAFLLELYK